MEVSFALKRAPDLGDHGSGIPHESLLRGFRKVMPCVLQWLLLAVEARGRAQGPWGEWHFWPKTLWSFREIRLVMMMIRLRIPYSSDFRGTRLYVVSGMPSHVDVFGRMDVNVNVYQNLHPSPFMILRAVHGKRSSWDDENPGFPLLLSQQLHSSVKSLFCLQEEQTGPFFHIHDLWRFRIQNDRLVYVVKLR